MMIEPLTTYKFLKGGGELGVLIESYNWSETSVGEIEQWPQSLRTTLGIMLHSKQPMVLWWGEDLVQFYNDAFRQSLGETGKHPEALGQTASETWNELWQSIGPLVEQVKISGQPVMQEDQLVPIYRNGAVDEVYWTYSYSPVFGESGMIEGILVITAETTRKVELLLKKDITQRLLEQNERNLKNIILQAPVAMCIFKGPDHVVEIANERMFEIWGKTSEDILGKSIFAGLPEAREQGYEKLLNDVYATGKTLCAYGQAVNLPRGNKIETVYVNYVYEALIEDDRITGVMAVALDVTPQVLATKRIAESELKFRSLIEEAVIATALLEGRDMVLQVANDAMLEIWDRDRSIIGKRLLEFMPELEDQAFPKILDEVFTSGNFYSAEDALVKLVRGGKITDVYMDFSYKALRNHDGVVYGILVFATDVTQRWLSKKALERSQEKLSMAIQIAELGTYHVDPISNTSSYSERILDWFGIEDEFTPAESMVNCIVEDDRERVIRTLGDTFLNPEASRHDIYYRIKNQKTGQERHLRSIGKTTFDTDGRAIALIGTMQDVTAQMIARNKIEESEMNLRRMITQAPVAMCILMGPSYIVEVANDVVIELWGKPRSNVMNKPLFEALPDAAEQGLEQLLIHVYTTGETFRANERPVVLLRNGKLETVYLDFVYEPYKNAKLEIIGILVVAVDVTRQVLARQRIEEVVAERTRELADANTSLRLSNNQLAQFAYIASHDLQEPARKITTFTEMLANNYHDQERATRYIEKIAGASQRMLTLIRDVLKFSQVQKDKSLFTKVDLNQVFENTKSDFELMIERKDAVITSNSLPVIDGITVQLNQLFANLISNSLKFVPDGRKPQVSILCDKAKRVEIRKFPQLNADERHFKITFRDNGIGFSAEHAEQIFDIFQRLHGRSEYEGNGIGLAICRKIAENHNGVLFASSQEGNGAEFTLIVPEFQQQG